MIKNRLIQVFIICGLFSCSNQHVDYIQSYYYNEKYRYLMNKKQYDKAQKAELLSKENLQDHFQQDSNLGIVFNILSKNDEALKSFELALKNAEKQYSEDSEAKAKALFTVHFNRGAFLGGQNKIDEALNEYQKALDINPASIEVKTNIELLIQKLKDDQKNGQGKGDQDKKDNKDQSGESKNNDQEGDKSDQQEKKQQQDRKQTGKYKPRPFQGEQLSEGDVKKILGELSQQDKKIRSQFDKKEKTESRFEGKNEKDW